MGDPLPPDPYIALGVAKDATAAAIKTQYRKLVLKFHPDKVQDETQKQAAADQFHKIQTAYEIVSDEARRARYDAQYKLSELRKDVMERERGGRRGSSDDDRGPRYAPQQESAREYPPRERGSRVSPQYSTEERRPSYAPQDYFDPQPRASARKDAGYERSSRRTPLREERTTKSSKASSVGSKKKDDRSGRKEKSKKSDRDVRQDRQRKFATTVVEEESSSDSDPYERRRREMRDEDSLRKVREQYWEHERQQREQADQGYFGDERTRKLFSQSTEARDYIGRSGRTPRTEEPERRPSPVRMSSSRDRTEQKRPSTARMSSSKDQVEYVKRNSDRPPVMIRRGSGRPQTTGHASERRTREPETVVEEPVREGKRPPTLSHAKSSPPVVQPETRPQAEKQRSYSVQMDADRNDEAPPVPKMRRAETMPYHRHKATVPEKGSRLRTSAYPTPETSPERQPRKFNYGQQQAYADDVEYASPDGYEVPAQSNRYETEERRPQRGSSSKRDRYAEEPAVAKDARDRQRSSSTKHAAQPPPMPSRTNSTQYVYPEGREAYVRPGMVSRESSSRGGALYGEIPTTSRGSPGVSRSRHSPPESPYSRNLSSEQPVSMQSGFNVRTKDRPSMGQRRDTRSRQVA